ncbi:hypothetical protein PIROE2DRAFT_8323 [Piromyces sp. E2]|nr:hypothetical protein PIROE2DRAFT_8323 [Piromyces sp. E2]|eukprot:OUM64786.1 hypothetical protein PIROE2DRAFT_8323 [Piromyces sp. E2]
MNLITTTLSSTIVQNKADTDKQLNIHLKLKIYSDNLHKNIRRVQVNTITNDNIVLLNQRVKNVHLLWMKGLNRTQKNSKTEFYEINVPLNRQSSDCVGRLIDEKYADNLNKSYYDRFIKLTKNYEELISLIYNHIAEEEEKKNLQEDIENFTPKDSKNSKSSDYKTRDRKHKKDKKNTKYKKYGNKSHNYNTEEHYR